MKRIVICADGTWNARDQQEKGAKTRRPTNVTKVARAVLPRAGDVDQVVIYHEGVGTAGGFDKYTGGAFGDGIENNIRELYRSIVYNYNDGDQLFFFGFSRGAFTVRSLAGFMNMVGLVQKGDDYWVPEVYGCYEQGQRPGSPQWKSAVSKFEYPVRPCPPITFLGVWDTVGALGPPGVLGQIFARKKYEYHIVSLNQSIKYAYQALAIDERRRPFAPSVWDRPADWVGTLEQAWFAGVHSDVGGGQDRDGLANQALHWMVEKAHDRGLGFDASYLDHYKPCFDGTLHDSMSLVYRAMIPITRPIGAHGQDERPHQAAIDRNNSQASAYSPSNLLEYLGQHASIAPYQTQLPASRVPCEDSPPPRTA
jgi:uncharacterized protein (DUF2235 family)